MDLVVLLSLLLAGAGLALIVALVSLLVVGRGGVLSQPRRLAWAQITMVHCAFVVSGWVVNLQYLIWPEFPGRQELGYLLYNSIFILNGVLDGALPLLLLLIFLRGTPFRRWPLLGLLGIVATALVGVVNGVLNSWERMLDVSQLLTFEAIAAYLILLGLYLLHRLPEMDLYLAIFVAINALFQLLLPVQEVFFQVVGISSVIDIWHLHQFLQLTATGIQVAVVLSAINSVRYRRLMPVFRPGAER